MCDPIFGTAFGLGGAGAATAAGATAAATTAAAGAGAGLASIGTTLATVGSLFSAVNGLQAGRAQAAAYEQQAQDQQRLTAMEDQRRRREYMTAMAQQRAELAARGVTLDSPTAIALGQTAAAEMSFDSQSIRAGGGARVQELRGASAMARAQGFGDFLKGTASAAGSLLSAPREVWPGFLRKRLA